MPVLLVNETSSPVCRLVISLIVTVIHWLTTIIGPESGFSRTPASARLPFLSLRSPLENSLRAALKSHG